MNTFEINSICIPYKQRFVEIVFDLKDVNGVDTNLGSEVFLDGESYKIVAFNIYKEEKEFASITLLKVDK